MSRDVSHAILKMRREQQQYGGYSVLSFLLKAGSYGYLYDLDPRTENNSLNCFNYSILLLRFPFPEPTLHVTATAGDPASLPCDSDPRHTYSGDHAVKLVLWFKDESTAPIYS